MKHVISLIFFLPLFATAQLQVAKIFSHNMILQRDQPVRIWGKTNPGKKVVVFFAHERKAAVAGKDSAWTVVFNRQKANTEPQSIFITCGTEKIELKNILIGDLWLCIGQSNMEFPMQKEVHFREEVARANQPLLHFYNPSFAGRNIYAIAYSDSVISRLNKNDFYIGKWEACDSNTVKNMSAVAYYFAKKIIQSERIPVGLINLSIGGAPLETFISRTALQSNRQFREKLNGNWLMNDALPVWIRERGMQNVGGNKLLNEDSSGPAHAYKPGYAFENGIQAILSLPIKGMICYQGESNAQEAGRVKEYANLQQLLINDYRKLWKQPSMPFYWVQLSSIDSLHYKSQLWPQFRDEQRRLLSKTKYTGMAVCSDLGFKNDVHPTNKKEVGERLARWALYSGYKRKVIPSGPLPLSAKYVNGQVIISFQYVAEGLQTADKKPVRGFSTDGKTETDAVVQNNSIVIEVKEKPLFVYYAWKPFTDANLVNSEQLPASTFKINVD